MFTLIWSRNKQILDAGSMAQTVKEITLNGREAYFLPSKKVSNFTFVYKRCFKISKLQLLRRFMKKKKRNMIRFS